MRKIKKKQAKDFLRLLGQAHLEIRKAIEAKKYELARDLLEQCQDGAIELGNMIEEQEGEGFVTVSLLEEYCELVYQLHEEIWQKKATMPSAGKMAKSLKRQLIRIENSVKNDISETIEVVFLPYKASMWDSLESVWRAADEAPDCDAYVIPIPYFDRNPDGSFREMHDERKLYPADVPITDYESFDFAEHRPDMIFIHNPYDNNNYVTSVHPAFYSDKLKQYTDKLVYIPYFILGDVDLDNEEAIKGMAHFVTTPAVVNADKVIVQSENMRQAYVKAMVMVTGEHTRGYWEEKILGLGSPKIDKVMATRKADVEVPEAWRKVIEKEDGSWKKIIFYNTSVQALLNHNEKMMAKIKDVLQVFKENQEDVVLLWRPHPLIEATIKSVRPGLWEEYRGIVESYRNEGWGIYDDTADLDRAVALCDAYYGDRSSVVQLCRETGMPVMIQDTGSRIRNNYSIAMDNIVEYQGEWWFLAMKDNGLYKMKKDKLEAKLVIRIPYFNPYPGGHPEYGNIHICKDKVFIFPAIVEQIVVYDIKKDELRYISYENTNPKRGRVFWDGIEYKNKLYLIPCGYTYILCIDIVTEEMKKIEIESTSDDCWTSMYAWGSILKENENVIFTKLFEDKIICVNLETEKKKIYECKWLNGGGAGICGDNECVWILPRKTDKVFCWDRNEKILHVYDDFPEEYDPGEWSFYKLWLDEKLYLLPRDANMCITVDKKTGKMERLEVDVKPCSSDDFYNRYMRYCNVWKDKDKVMIISSENGELFSVSKTKGINEEKIKIISDEYNQSLSNCIINEQKNRFENIEAFIKINVKKRSNEYMDSVGKDIFFSI